MRQTFIPQKHQKEHPWFKEISEAYQNLAKITRSKMNMKMRLPLTAKLSFYTAQSYPNSIFVYQKGLGNLPSIAELAHLRKIKKSNQTLNLAALKILRIKDLADPLDPTQLGVAYSTLAI